MNDRQRSIIEAAVAQLAPHAPGLSREQIDEILHNLVLDCRQLPRLSSEHEPARRMPLAGEVLPPHQRASWARQKTPHDLADVPDDRLSLVP